MKESAEQSSLASEAYSVVRQRILRGDIALGQVISRRKLAAELSMSFLPVSEALLRLEIEGLLESRPRAGTRVRIPSPEDVQGHYVVREALETQAARLFAQFASARDRSGPKKAAARRARTPGCAAVCPFCLGSRQIGAQEACGALRCARQEGGSAAISRTPRTP